MAKQVHKRISEEADSLIEQARAAGRKQDYVKAVEFGLRASQAYLDINDHASAGRQLEVVAVTTFNKLGDKKRSAMIDEQSGDAYLLAGNPKAAGDRLRVAASITSAHLKDHAKGADLHEKAGEAFFQAGAFVEAMDEFGLAAAESGKHLNDPFRASDNREREGDCLVGLKKYSEAGEKFLAQVKLLHQFEPLDMDCMIRLDGKSGDAFMEAKEYEKAGDSYTARAVNLTAHKKDYAEALKAEEKAGTAYLRADLPEKAGERYKSAGTLSKNHCTLGPQTMGYFCRGAAAYSTAGNTEEESYCWWQASEVAKQLGKTELAQQHADKAKQSKKQ